MATPAPPSPHEPAPTRSTLALKLTLGVGIAVAVLVPPVVLGTTITPSATGDQRIAELLVVMSTALALGGGPFVAGLMCLAWTVDPRTPEGRRSFGALALVVGTIVLSASVILILVSVTSAVVSTGIAFALSVGSITVTAGSIWVGVIIRERDAARPPRPSTLDLLEPRSIRRIQRGVIVTFAIALLASVIALGLIYIVLGGRPAVPPALAITSLSLAFLAAGAAGSVMLLPLSHQLQAPFHGDRSLQKRISTSVLTGAPLPNADEERVASRYAALMDGAYPLQLLQSALLLVGVLLSLVSNLVGGSSELHLLTVFAIALIALGAAVAFPFALNRVRRFRRYRKEHPDIAPEAL